MALLVFAIWSSVTRSQNGRGSIGTRRDDPLISLDLSARAEPIPPMQANSVVMPAEEKLVRDVYARLMRYQSAAVDELSATTGKESTPENYLTFELRAIHTGRIREIYTRPLVEIISPRDDEVINMNPNHLSKGNDPPHASYSAEWVNAKAWDHFPNDLRLGMIRPRSPVRPAKGGDELPELPIG